MKALITTTFLGLLFLTMTGHAQDKPKAPEKPVYRLNDNKPISVIVTFTVPAGFINSYLYVESQGGPQAIQSSAQLTGQQITGLIQIHKAVMDTLNNHLQQRFNDFVKADQLKFTADTTAKYYPPKK